MFGGDSIIFPGNNKLPRFFTIFMSGGVEQEAPAKGGEPPKGDRFLRVFCMPLSEESPAKFLGALSSPITPPCRKAAGTPSFDLLLRDGCDGAVIQPLLQGGSRQD